MGRSLCRSGAISLSLWVDCYELVTLKEMRNLVKMFQVQLEAQDSFAMAYQCGRGLIYKMMSGSLTITQWVRLCICVSGF